jgi:hypothetical protein
MFIAEMWEYGMDPDCVGVDGIDACMGVFVLYDKKLFAIHVPYHLKTHKEARDKFVGFFNNKNPGYQSGAKIYAVVNGDSRGGAEDEVSEFGKALKAETTKFMRVVGHSGHSIAIVCERDPFTDDVKLKYTPHAEAGWERGKGTKREGYYNNDIGDHQYSVASTDTWKPIVDPVTAQVKSPNAPFLIVASSNKSNKSNSKCAIM